MRTYVLVGLVLSMAACGEEPAPEAPVARPVKIVELGSDAVTGAREFPGSVSPAQHADMAFEVPGRIIAFPVNEGQLVARGQVLARLDPQDFEAQRDRESARRNAARANYERYQELYASDAVSLQDLEVMRREFEVSDANLRTAQKALDDTYLRAPFAGRVANKLVEDFANVQAKQPVLQLQDDSSLEIVIGVPEGTLSQTLSAGREVETEVEISAYPGLRFPARIKEFATSADPVTRTFEATLTFEAPDDIGILPGMTARVVATVTGVSGRDGYALPAGAVLSDEGGGASVWRIDPADMSVHRTPVELGEISGSTIIVTAGLDMGDQIAVSGVHNLREGMLVRPLDP